MPFKPLPAGIMSFLFLNLGGNIFKGGYNAVQHSGVREHGCGTDGQNGAFFFELMNGVNNIVNRFSGAHHAVKRKVIFPKRAAVHCGNFPLRVIIRAIVQMRMFKAQDTFRVGIGEGDHPLGIQHYNAHGTGACNGTDQVLLAARGLFGFDSVG
ncbi:MAG: hypothetical protein BWX80_01563 [Candidatus Hydrogenedentes bacterium ADurb.Bin101]|nr:MAG: hypothetical protein BWX80_01563 [Candidatus Hydrogenedentes bacterium ADurb.Bin101]